MDTKIGVYICSVGEDLEWAGKVRRDLSESGFRAWLADEDIRPGEKREVSIRKAIRDSRYFLALLSSNSVSKRGMVQKELKYALDLLDEFPEDDIYIIPIRLDDCRPAYEKLRKIQWIDFFPVYESGYQSLLGSIQSDAGPEKILPAFEHDLFISFASADNRTAFEDQTGWVSFFIKCLEIRLHQITGDSPDIFRRPKPGVETGGEAALLVPVLSPSYVKTEQCLDELHLFLQSARKGAGVRINDMPRIFKAVKTHVPPEKEPPGLGGFPRYEFYRFDAETGRHSEFVSGFGREIDRDFWERLDDMAHDMARPLEVVKSGAFSPVEQSGVRVYLAETASDACPVKNAVRRELNDRGYAVLPENALPLSGEGLEREITNNLEQCAFSIHIIGDAYGIVPEERNISIVELQHHLAMEHQLGTPDFTRVVWLPIGLKPKDGRQDAFIRELLDNPVRQPGDDLLQTTVDELKTVIIEKLENPVAEHPSACPQNSIYLIFDRSDESRIDPIRKILAENGFHVLTPLAEGDETDIREAHQENLRTCHGICVYCGNAGKAWLNGKLRDLMKARGLEGAVPKVAAAVYLAGPETETKREFEMSGAIVIKNYGEYSNEDLKPFLEKFASGGRPS